MSDKDIFKEFAVCASNFRVCMEDNNLIVQRYVVYQKDTNNPYVCGLEGHVVDLEKPELIESIYPSLMDAYIDFVDVNEDCDVCETQPPKKTIQQILKEFEKMYGSFEGDQESTFNNIVKPNKYPHFTEHFKPQ